jgi:hypothetical protein
MPASATRVDGWLTRSRLLLGCAGVVVAIGAIVLAQRSGAVVEPTGTLASRPPVFTPDAWAAGATASYAITWRSDADVSVNVGPAQQDVPAADVGDKRTLGTHLDIDGELTLRSYGPQDGAVVLGVVLSKVNVAKAEALGQPAATPEQLGAELRAGEAVALVEPDGHVRELGFSKETTTLARGALRALVLEYTAEVSAANGRPIVDTSLGRARIAKTDAGATKRVAYDELDALPDGFDQDEAKVASTGAGTVSGSGRAVTAITSNEEISAPGSHGIVSRFHAKTAFSAKLLRTSNDPPSARPSYVPAPVHGFTPPPEQEDDEDRVRSLERRSLGVTPESLYADVRTAGLAPAPSRGLTEWVWRDSAYLELHPEQTSLLLDRAMKDPIGMQAAAIDIVVISRTDAAQRALMFAFDKTKLTNDDREILFQHLGQLMRPSQDFLRWAEAEHDRSKGTDLWLATSYTLGGLAWHASETFPEISNRLVDKLEGELRQATTDPLREIAIRALGNAGAQRSLPLLVPYAKSKDVAVRAAVASALRRIDGEASVDALLLLVADPDDFVSRDAVASLYRKNLDEADWQALATAVDENRVAESTQTLLVDGALVRRMEDPGVAHLFTSLLASPHVALKLKQRIAAVQ